MSISELVSDEGLRSAIESVSRPPNRGDEWIRQLAETLRWVRAADVTARASRDFQWKLWEDNHVAAIGQGNIRVDEALDDATFRRWLAAKSMEALPPSWPERLRFLTTLYEDIKAKFDKLLTRKKVPHLKIFRVMAALYPEAMTTVASAGKLGKLARAMGSGRRLDPVERHIWVRERIDSLIGGPGADPLSLAARITLPWALYAQFVQTPSEVTENETGPGQEPELVPLPAARRRRGLTAIKGMFPAALSALEFVRDGVTRAELLDFLRASSPDSKASSLGVTLNVLQSELGAIRLDGDRYVLTERGEDVLESQDPSHLADWILTRILGADKAIVELRDRGPLAPSELTAAIRSTNPSLTSDFVPQSIVSWLRSMGVIETTPQSKHALTDVGRQWASRITWEPESLRPEPEIEVKVPPVVQPDADAKIALPSLPDILASIQKAGHFSASLVASLHAGLWSHSRRHFAILTGLSGSGKTLLAREYARALTGRASAERFTLPVQPGWYDPGALLGFTNPLRGDAYVRTGFLEFLIAAAGNPQRPYVVVLDEMNLSHPEQYMAPLLSAMETGDTIQLHTEGDFFDGVPGSIAYPSNLVLIGTVNMDETTHGLSDKVLDRAFVLEFWDIDLAEYPRWGTRSINPSQENRAREVLTALMQALSPARLHFGWRVVDDVLDFLSRATAFSTALPFESALDGVIYAKVLPKLRGEDAPRFREALSQCEQALAKFGLERSRAKIAELKNDVESTGSARFWR